METGPRDSLLGGQEPTGPSRLGRYVALGALLAVAVTVALRGSSSPEVGLPLWVVAATAVPFVTLPLRRFGRLWASLGAYYSAIWISVLIAATGGARSPFSFLFVVLLILSALRFSRGRLALLSVMVVVGAVSPALYDARTDWEYMQDVAFNAGLVVAAAFVIQHLVSRLSASEEQFRSLAQQTSDIVYRYRVRPTRGFEFINDVVETMTGFPPQRFFDDPGLVWERMHPDDRERHRSLRQDAEHIHEPFAARWERADGTWIWLEERLSPVYDSAGNIELVNGTIRDVTLQKGAEERLVVALDQERHAADRLREVDVMKNSFLQAVSHELRTPLTSLVGYAETMRARRDDLTEGQAELLLDRLTTNAEKLQRLLTNLLDVDRLSRGNVVAVRTSTELGGLAFRVAEELAVQTGHLVTVDVEEVVANVDAPKVERILENLIGNAIKHTPDGTRVTVQIESIPPGGAHIVVSDAGPGVPEPMREQIFEPFMQGPQSREDASPGTGIGLALVGRLAALHGGRAWVEDAPGGGAAFHVVLPGTDDASGDPDLSDSAPEAARDWAAG